MRNYNIFSLIESRKTWSLFITLLTALTMLGARQVPSLFSDHKSFNVGDVITIIIEESTSAEAAAGTDTDVSAGLDFSVSGTGFMDKMYPGGYGASLGGSSAGDGKTSRSGKIESKMTAKIIDIDDMGNLVIKGSRTVEINGEKEITELQGVVRPEDVKSDNSVYSYSIADAKIKYDGKGAINETAKVGILSRIINWLF